MLRTTGLMLCLVLFGACAKKGSMAARPPAGSHTRLAQVVEESVQRMRLATATMQGLAWVVLHSEARVWQTEAAIVAARPDRLRVDVIDALADVWAQLGSDGRHMWLFLPDKGKLYKGRSSARNMRRLASFDASPSELVSALAGVAPLAEGVELVQLGAASDGHLADVTGRLHLWVEKGRRGSVRVVRCVRYAEGGKDVDYEIAFSDFRREEGVEFPHTIKAAFPASGASLVLEYRDVKLGGEISPDVFSAPSRRSRKTVELSEGK